MGSPFDIAKTTPFCVLSVTLHNRMDETILVLPETFIPHDSTGRADHADESLVDLIASMHGSESDTLGFWVFISNPTTGVREAHHFLTPLQILAHAVLQCEGRPSAEQILVALEYDTTPDQEGHPPPLPKVRFVDKVTQVRLTPAPEMP